MHKYHYSSFHILELLFNDFFVYAVSFEISHVDRTH